MDEPKAKDFGLSESLIKEILTFNNEKTKQWWLLTHCIVVGTALGISMFGSTQENRIAIFGGLLITLYVLNYVQGIRFLTRFFFRAHPLTINLLNYQQALNQYKAHTKETLQKTSKH